jgi:hypothetical protein
MAMGKKKRGREERDPQHNAIDEGVKGRRLEDQGAPADPAVGVSTT